MGHPALRLIAWMLAEQFSLFVILREAENLIVTIL